MSTVERILPAAANHSETERPKPPYGMSKDESIEWYNIVNKMPPDYFDPRTHFILERLCKHLVASRKDLEELEENIRKLDPIERIKAAPTYTRCRNVIERTTIMFCMRLKLMKPEHGEKAGKIARRESLKAAAPAVPWFIPGRSGKLGKEYSSTFEDYDDHTGPIDDPQFTYPRQ
jgi:hypothetical protein